MYKDIAQGTSASTLRKSVADSESESVLGLLNNDAVIDWASRVDFVENT